MRGFAVVDSQPDSPIVVVWHTKRVDQTVVDHTNAVQVDLSTDGDAAKAKLDSLLADLQLVLTEGSTTEALPTDGHFRTAFDIAELSESAHAHSQSIAQAVDDYIKRTRKYSLTRPSFPASAAAITPPTHDSTAVERALNLANFVKVTWNHWLLAEEERRKRTTDGRGNSPWMMPDNLSAAEIAEFPGWWSDGLETETKAQSGA